MKLTVTASSEVLANQAIDAGFAEIRAVHHAADLFSSKSEISSLNASGKLGLASEAFLDLVHGAHKVFELSGGAFDATVQPLWTLWAQNEGGVPDAAAMKGALSRVGWRNLERHVDRVVLHNSAALTFNGIAQGYAADRVLKVMQIHGALSAMADTGETGLLNFDGGLAIRNPRKETVLGMLRVTSGFVAISGDYASSFSDDFRNHHIIDPRLGMSPRELASVAVVAPTGMMADGLATAFMVMGREKSLACLAQLPGHAALFVNKSGDVSFSPAMLPLFKTLAT